MTTTAPGTPAPTPDKVALLGALMSAVAGMLFGFFELFLAVVARLFGGNAYIYLAALGFPAALGLGVLVMGIRTGHRPGLMLMGPFGLATLATLAIPFIRAVMSL